MNEPLSIELIVLGIISIIIILILTSYAIYFVIFYHKRKRQNVFEKRSMQERFERELLLAQLETQNLTLQQIGEELHDNIGQILTVISIRINTLEISIDQTAQRNTVREIGDLVTTVISDIRLLSKTLDHQFLVKVGLLDSLALELSRVEKTGRIKTQLNKSGKPYPLGEQVEIVFLRMVQEVINNVLKHACARNLRLYVVYNLDHFILNVTDDGKGFDIRQVSSRDARQDGSGLRNLRRRAELLGARLTIESKADFGTSIEIRLQM